MRTTVNLDPEAEQAVAALRRARGLGVSEAVNALIREGAAAPRVDYAYHSIAFDMGARLPLDKTSDVLDLLDEADR
ncbi:hypothetical protein GCM10028815_18760 [Mariniluteicoccus flavus]